MRDAGRLGVHEVVTDVIVGSDRIMLSAYNPRTELTLLKCVYVLERAHAELADVDEKRFREWLATKPAGQAILAKLDAGWRPGPLPDQDAVDPRDARAKARILAYLAAEQRDQRGAAGGVQ